jgi:hypothetical protein
VNRILTIIAVVGTLGVASCGSEPPTPPPAPPKPLTFEGKRLSGAPADAKADGFVQCEPANSNSSEPAYRCYRANRAILGVEADKVSVFLDKPMLDDPKNPNKELRYDGIEYAFPELKSDWDCKEDPADPFHCYQHAERFSTIHKALIAQGYTYEWSRYGYDYYSRRQPVLIRISHQSWSSGTLTVGALTPDDWQFKLKKIDDQANAVKQAAARDKAFTDSMSAPGRAPAAN